MNREKEGMSQSIRMNGRSLVWDVLAVLKTLFLLLFLLWIAGRLSDESSVKRVI